MSESPRLQPRRPKLSAARYRRLVRCNVCLRQFDAAALAPGERFRCVCGASLRVPRSGEREAQEAPVVRCASCGAPRAAGAETCVFCNAPFALGEGARNTLCPVCASRIGDAQRYCHSCGTLIAPEAVAGGVTEFACPACKPPRNLSSRRITEATTTLAMLECGGCAGIWLGHRTFEALQGRAQREGTPESLARRSETAPHSTPGSATVAYRPCPVCRKLMARRNFAATSGIVVDVCGADGLWFDAAELDGILAWIRDGGLARADARRTEETKEVARRAAITKLDLGPMPPDEPAQRHWIDVLSTLGELILGVGNRLR